MKTKGFNVLFQIRYVNGTTRKFAVVCDTAEEQDTILKDVYSIDGVSYLKKSTAREIRDRQVITYKDYMESSWANWLFEPKKKIWVVTRAMCSADGFMSVDTKIADTFEKAEAIKAEWSKGKAEDGYAYRGTIDDSDVVVTTSEHEVPC